jgi:hypothetical protein
LAANRTTVSRWWFNYFVYKPLADEMPVALCGKKTKKYFQPIISFATN